MTHAWTIALFAGIADRIGSRALELSWEEATLTVAQIKQRLQAQYPEHADLVALCFMARNRAFVSDETQVGAADELALLPPVSGGIDEQPHGGRGIANRFVITDQPIDVNEVASRVYHPDHGATIAFVGTTREWTKGKRTVTLEYEAYIPMAESAMEQIGAEIGERWPGTATAIAHRLGTVGINEISVVIAVSSPHRAEAYDASRYAIERLKMTVPIWKKEIYEDGTEWKGHQLGPWNPLASYEGQR
ncbi:molybdenum cofactor biosynthesis protein [Cohnella panacarvi]|uniref:molybdenum cofactor biosynthesis protein n=1 Tax=Cohnella panacarvi TaxID=400776 RepID=UPI00047AC4F5|nr:molybdenum cofactor biosynthesis protein MoaE [Cohnella panacarvi]